MWSLLLYTAVSIAAVSYIWIQLREEGRPVFHILLTGAIVSSVLSIWFEYMPVSVYPYLSSGLHMGTLTFLMIWITTVIWHLKPIYARYPRLFTMSPTLLLAGFPWIASIPSLMALYFMIIESAILLIIMLLWFSLQKRLNGSIWFVSTLIIGVLLWLGDQSQFFSSIPWSLHLISCLLLMGATMMYQNLIQSIHELQG
ncbi:MAG: hypothetical protein WD115_01100 [Balneolaceae bacterium]